jgi:DNA-binding response OmpR family regulator
MWFWNIGARTERELPSSRPLAGLRVLLVEEAFDVHRRNARALQEAGASVNLECGWRSAFDHLRRRPDEYDAVVFDLDLPLPDQAETTRRLRDGRVAATILGLTLKTDREVPDQGFARGCDAVIRAPIDGAKVAAAIGRTQARQRRLA